MVKTNVNLLGYDKFFQFLLKDKKFVLSLNQIFHAFNTSCFLFLLQLYYSISILVFTGGDQVANLPQKLKHSGKTRIFLKAIKKLGQNRTF